MSLLIRNFTKKKVSAKELEATMAVVISEERIKKEVEVSLVFVGDKRIRALNKKYRGIDKVTDVLSFEGENDDVFISPDNDTSYLGEIFICFPRAEKQAKEKKHSVKKEINILFVHGLFHLLGYDHIRDEDYKLMNKKESKLLRKIYE